MKKSRQIMEDKRDEKQAQQNRPAAKSQKATLHVGVYRIRHIPILGNEKTAPKLI